MESNDAPLTNIQDLRKNAEAQLKKMKGSSDLDFTPEDILKLIHELEVHQIELEMQQEELLIAKERAESSEKKYIQLYDYAPTGYLSLLRDGTISDLNFVAAHLLGKERSRLVKNPFEKFLAADSTLIFQLFFHDVFTTDTKHTCEVIIATDGQLPVYVFVEGQMSQSGDFCVMNLTDFTDKKLADIHLLAAKMKAEENEARFMQLVENIDDCFWLRDDHSMLYVSPGFEKIWGLPCLSLYQNPQLFTDSIHPDDQAAVAKMLQSSDFQNNGYFNYDYRIIRKDKTIRWINAKTFPIKDQNNKIYRRAGIAIDITEKIQKQLELVIAKEHAEESDNLKSAFLANMSHEIRTPMNGILGFAELLKNPNLTGKEQQDYIHIIQKSGARMLNIINDIVDISKIEAGLMKIYLSETNINDQIEDLYAFFKPEVEEKGMTITFSNALPSCEAFIQTDGQKVFAILTNLVKNAIKYTVKGSIHFGYFKKEEMLEFFVRDTGIGIPKDRQEAIYERFIQADISNSHIQQGAGLGLSISKAYVEMLGGQLWNTSEVGKGSCFYFTLPYTLILSNGCSNNELDVLDIKALKRNLKILIVEDDVISKELLSISMRYFVKEIFEANTGEDAVRICQKNPDIDLILMDIQLPEMNGNDATRQIRKFNKDVVIIAQTAYGFSSDKEMALSAGCNDYISKPIDTNLLISLIQKYFR